MTSKIPKSKQIYFFMMPEETKSVLKYLAEQNYWLFAPHSTIAKPTVITSFDDYSQFFFCPKPVNTEIYMYKLKNGLFALDSSTSSVIEFDCPILRKKELACGRIYFRGGYIGRDEWIAFPKILYESFKKVSSFIKNTFLTKDRLFNAYLSKGSKQYVSDGGCLVQF